MHVRSRKIPTPISHIQTPAATTLLAVHNEYWPLSDSNEETGPNFSFQLTTLLDI